MSVRSNLEFTTANLNAETDLQLKKLIRREGLALFKVLVPFLAIVIIIYKMQDFVMNAVRANVAINGLIITAALYGVVLIVMRLIGAQKDYYVIERFGREAMRGKPMIELLQEPWLQKRTVRHYLGHVAKTGGTLASAIQQNAIENELRTLSADYEHKLELPQFIVGFMVAMGLLGTFVGLLETLTGISGMLDGFGQSGVSMDEQFMKLVVELRKPLAGMGIAFSASMFGLVTSLMLAIMMINLRRYIGHVVSCARNVMHDLIELRYTAGGPNEGLTQAAIDDLLEHNNPTNGMVSNFGRVFEPASIADGSHSMQDLVYQASDASLAIAGRIDVLTLKIDALLQVFESSIKTTQKQNGLLGEVLPHMSAVNDGILKELKEIRVGQVEQHKFSQISADESRHASNAIQESIRAQREMQANLTVSLQDLGQKLSKIEDGAGSVGYRLDTIKEYFINLGLQFPATETISNGIGNQTLLLETLVKEDRNLQKRLISIQQDLRERLQPAKDEGDKVETHA